MYVIDVEHRGLKKHRVIRGNDLAVVDREAELQCAAWDRQWAARSQREARQAYKRTKSAEATIRTAEAQRAIEQLHSILSHTLQVDHAVDWEELKRSSGPPVSPPPKPCREDFTLPLGWLDHLFSSRKRRKIKASQAQYDQAIQKWHLDIQQWQADADALQQSILKHNRAIDAHKLRYLNDDADAISEYCDMVLSRSPYPDFFPQEFQVNYEKPTKILVVDYRLPGPGDLPTLKEARYIAARDEIRDTNLKQREIEILYDRVVFQVALRTIHEVLEADQIDAIDAVVFNGWVHYVDPRTGHSTKACIASLQATKLEFEQINLAAVEPKECFRALKGVAASKLASMAAVAPILQLNKKDTRFVASREVAGRLERGTNIAAIGWEEFEHLVREIFAAEFSKGGGEVKVTQSSRDGGVDAIAFDPDPVRGGKIVIQAKRYTNPVGVGAVRDLYGTVINEGATKGILVTTSSFGPDAYRFAKDKPLTLLEGSHLLHLLSKHGHNARIDLLEARKLGVGLKR